MLSKWFKYPPTCVLFSVQHCLCPTAPTHPPPTLTPLGTSQGWALRSRRSHGLFLGPLCYVVTFPLNGKQPQLTVPQESEVYSQKSQPPLSRGTQGQGRGRQAGWDPLNQPVCSGLGMQEVRRAGCQAVGFAWERLGSMHYWEVFCTCPPRACLALDHIKWPDTCPTLTGPFLPTVPWEQG